jgi:hypothetical protein
MKPQPQAPAFTIPTADYRSKETRDDCLTPGPTSYSYDPSATKPAAPALSIAARIPEPSCDDPSTTPAPGDFAPPPSFPSGPAYTFPMHATDPSARSGQECAPGVGDYDVACATEPSAPAFSFPRTARLPEIAEDGEHAGIGPGAYMLPPVSQGPAFTMGEAPKERIVPGVLVSEHRLHRFKELKEK